MSILPVVEHHRADPPTSWLQSVDPLVAELRRDIPELSVSDEFRDLVPQQLQDATTLHLDDLSDIPLLDSGRDVRFMQDRARMRAGEGDFVVSCTDPLPAFESYCQKYLGLGSPQWLHPRPLKNPLRVSAACLQDRAVRRKLIHELRCGDLLYVHPLMGTFSVWETAALLHRASRLPVKVIAPPPGVTKWVNDKIAFAETVARLFGAAFVPRTHHVSNFSMLARQLQQLADGSQVIAIKLPDSAGGGGNLVVESKRFRGVSLHVIHDHLKQLMHGLAWDGGSRLLVGSWETDVLSAPSSQLWIPPEHQGPPVVEGLFEQTIEGREGVFVGSKPAQFSNQLNQELVDRSWLLGRLFQRLGYVGRCSFDMLLIGGNLESCRIEFIECNGRWGGTSIPMLLINRLFGDWATRPYAARENDVEGLDRFEFGELLDLLADDLYDVRTGQGRVILYNPGRLSARSGINVIALGESWDEAAQMVQETFPARLRKLAEQRIGR